MIAEIVTGRLVLVFVVACGPTAAPKPAEVPRKSEVATPAPMPLSSSARVPLLGPVVGRVIGVSIESGDMILTVDRGSQHGIAPNWHACILRPEDEARCAEWGALTIVDVKPTLTKARSTVTFDMIPRGLNVRFEPP